MSLPVIAIIVSVTSALFTATNVAISYAAYKRVRPRIRVEAEFEWDETQPLLEMGVRIINHGQTPLKLSSDLYLVFTLQHLAPRRLWLLAPWKWLFARMQDGWDWYLPALVDNIRHTVLEIRDDEPREVSPFGEVLWERSFGLEELRNELGKGSFRGERLSVLVAIPQPLGEMASTGFCKLPQMPERLARIPGESVPQLSFDDLLAETEQQ